MNLDSDSTFTINRLLDTSATSIHITNHHMQIGLMMFVLDVGIIRQLKLITILTYNNIFSE